MTNLKDKNNKTLLILLHEKLDIINDRTIVNETNIDWLKKISLGVGSIMTGVFMWVLTLLKVK